jgi:predicted DNA-binding transcriptional regulator AlpA
MSATPSKTAALTRLVTAGLTPLGLDRVQAAAYVGIGATRFDAMVKDGRMPKPKRVGKVGTVWDVAALAQAFRALHDSDGAVPLDESQPPLRVADVYDRAEA